MPPTICNPEIGARKSIKTGGALETLTVLPCPGEEISGIWNRLMRELRGRELSPLHFLIYGNVAANAPSTEALEKNFGRVDWPITWADGAACNGSPIAGVQAFACHGEIERLMLGDTAVASIFNDGSARHCLIGGLKPE